MLPTAFYDLKTFPIGAEPPGPSQTQHFPTFAFRYPRHIYQRVVTISYDLVKILGINFIRDWNIVRCET